MGPGRQVLRWTIPGWLLFLFLFLFDGTRVAFGLPSPLWQIPKTDADVLLAIAAAGLPIGFLIYQIYFWVYWSFPFPTVLGLGEPRDRAKDILRDVLGMDFVQLIAHNLHETPDTATDWKGSGLVKFGIKSRKIMMQYRDNWALANFVWHKTIADNEVEFLDATAEGYSDIYHSLGTARWALCLAFAVHLIAAVMSIGPQYSEWHPWAALTINLFLTIIIFRAFTVARYDTLTTLLRFKHDLITYYQRFPREKSERKSGAKST